PAQNVFFVCVCVCVCVSQQVGNALFVECVGRHFKAH
ncbi:hypothetical protein CPC197_1646, partial [Chlamydia psittaci C1/97]